MRKQSTMARIRKKANAATSSVNSNSNKDDRKKKNLTDPFHNGQTPSCRLLLHAVQDVFPEFQQQNQQQIPSSNIGQLLRWKFLHDRRTRKLPPAPPLVSMMDSTTSTPGGGGGGGTSKKKRKRKKKKKGTETASVATSVDGTADGTASEVMAMDSSHRSLDPSVDDLDLSLHQDDLKELPPQIPPPPPAGGSQQYLPSLDSLPSDDKNAHLIEKLHSSAVFFAQIQPQETEDNDNAVDPLPPPELGVQNDPVQQNNDVPITPNRPKNRSEHPSATVVIVTPTQPPQKELDPSTINSPNHEWVPEDGTANQPETRPGEAIMDPLELPFLLTFKETDGNATTTSTVDGSLISSEAAIKEEPNSFESTKALFEEWLDQLDDEPLDDRQKDYNSFMEFLRNKLSGSTQSLGIPLQDLKDSCNGIEGHYSKQQAMLEVSKLEDEKSDTKQIVLNPAYLHQQPTGVGQEMSLETAFDYVALEEGRHVGSSTDAQSQSLVGVIDANDDNEEEPDLESCLSFELSDGKQRKGSGGGGGGGKYLFLKTITQKQLDALVKVWLPSGIEEDVMVTTAVNHKPVDNHNGDKSRSKRKIAIILDNDEFESMQQNVLLTERAARDIISEIQELDETINTELESIQLTVEPQEQGANLEFKTFPVLKRCDENCTKRAVAILELLKFATSERSDALPEMQLNLWSSYLGVLSKALKACNKYYSTVEDEMADPRGVVPKMFLSAEHRHVYQELVEEKAKLWEDLAKQICSTLSDRVLREWCTRTVWEEGRSTVHFSEDSKQLDKSFHDLVRDLSRWTGTILGGKVSAIQKERMGRTERVLELLQAVILPLSHEYTEVEKYFSTERNNFFTNLRSSILLAQGVKTRMRLIDNNEVGHMATGAILMWRHVRLMQSYMIIVPTIPNLPLQLKRWMLLYDDKRLFSNTNDWKYGNGSSSSSLSVPIVSSSSISPSDSMGLGGNTNNNHGHTDNTRDHCMIPKNGGKRRVMCVLAGLVYRWLDERCQEWIAECAEKELLTNFYYDGSTYEKNGGTVNISSSTIIGQSNGTPSSSSATATATSVGGNTTKSTKSSNKRNKKKKNKGGSGGSGNGGSQNTTTTTTNTLLDDSSTSLTKNTTTAITTATTTTTTKIIEEDIHEDITTSTTTKNNNNSDELPGLESTEDSEMAENGTIVKEFLSNDNYDNNDNKKSTTATATAAVTTITTTNSATSNGHDDHQDGLERMNNDISSHELTNINGNDNDVNNTNNDNNNIDDAEEEGITLSPSVIDVVDDPSTVYVQDDELILSSKSFLVQRLETLLKATNRKDEVIPSTKSRSNNRGGGDVIVIQ